MKRAICLAVVLLAASPALHGSEVLAQDDVGTIAGVVADSSSRRYLVGANVAVPSTFQGDVTASDGSYRISNVAPGIYTVVASLIGYGTREYPDIMVGAGETVTLNIMMLESTIELGGVVVTALGVEREERSLTYGTQSVGVQEIAEARELNVGFSLAGKVAGLSVNQAGTGLGGQTRLILRGNRSISGSSLPLYVVDGVPIQGDISNLNPSDVEGISVLKGPNAAAIYGSAAQNGAIVITTKRGQPGRVSARFSTNFMMQQPLLLTKYQNEYGQGSGGVYQPGSEFSWGPKMTGQMVDHWSPDREQAAQYALQAQPNNVADVFRSGYQSSTNLTASVGSQRVQGFFSYSHTQAGGTVPGNELTRHNMQVRATSQPSDRLSLDGKLHYIRQSTDNRLATGENFTNPIRHIVRLPRNIRTEDAQAYEYLTSEGVLRQHYWNPGSNGGANPYWTLNRNLNAHVLDRVILLGSSTYECIDGLSLMVRGSYDSQANSGEGIIYNDTYIVADRGRYSLSKSNASVWNGDVLVSYMGNVAQSLNFDVNVGGNVQRSRNTVAVGTHGHRTDAAKLLYAFQHPEGGGVSGHRFPGGHPFDLCVSARSVGGMPSSWT